MNNHLRDEVKEYSTESGAVYTCDIQSNNGKPSFRWKRKGFNGSSVLEYAVLEDAVIVSLEKSQPLAERYRSRAIDESEFFDLARKNAIPAEGEREVIVYLHNGGLKSSTPIRK